MFNDHSSEFSNMKNIFDLACIRNICFYYIVLRHCNTRHISETNCWVPDHFSNSSVRFAQRTCHTQFSDVVYGRSTAKKAGVKEAFPTHIPCDDIDTNCTDHNYFATAIEIAQFKGLGLPEFSSEDIRNGMLYTTRMLNMLYVYAGLVILGFVIAVCFSHVAHANTCFLEAAWQSAAGGSGSDRYRAEGGDKGDLLNNMSTVVFRRLTMLADSRKLAISYFVFLVGMLFLFIILGGMTAHQTNLALKETNDQMDIQNAVYKKNKQIMKTHTQEAIGADQGNITSGKARAKQDSSGGIPLSEQDKHVKELFRPHPTHDSGNFLCDFKIHRLGNVHGYQAQCHYEVSRTPDKGHYNYMNMILEVKQATEAGWWLTLLMATLLVIHILNFFLFSPMSNQSLLILVMKEIGIEVPSRGLGFGFTDLSFVASFIQIGSRTRYHLRSRMWDADKAV